LGRFDGSALGAGRVEEVARGEHYRRHRELARELWAASLEIRRAASLALKGLSWRRLSIAGYQALFEVSVNYSGT
jgi:hypothetical protein